jgi:hypothetical protein
MPVKKIKGNCHPLHFLYEATGAERLRDENAQGWIVLYVSPFRI